MKEEDINLVPENVDVSEIDKLTANPKPNGKRSLIYFNPNLFYSCRRSSFCTPYVGALQHHLNQQIQGQGAAWHHEKRQSCQRYS